jgi:hypothetical protein
MQTKRSYLNVRRRPSGPSPRFTEWVEQYGKSRLARSLGVSARTVHFWVTPVGKRSRPGVDKALDIVALSGIEPLRGTVRLSLTDVLGAVRVTDLEVRQ